MTGLSDPQVTAAIIGGFIVLLTFAGGHIITQRSATDERRRERYSAAYQDLVAWAELPYRVRRRTGDGPDDLAALASHIHDLQERLACHTAWTASDCPRVGRWYAAALSAVKSRAAPAIAAAWSSPAIAVPTDMMIGDLGADCTTALALAAEAVAHPFGLRRFDLIRQLKLEDRSSVIRAPRP